MAAIRAGRLTPFEYAEALIERSEAHAGLGPLLDHDWDALRAAARRGPREGPLGGVPLVLKANIATDRLATCAGTAALAGQVARRPAAVARRLAEAGVLLGAKGNMHELAFGITSNNATTGAVRNPWDPERIAGAPRAARRRRWRRG